MKSVRPMFAAVLIAAFVTLASCTDQSPIAPQAAPATVQNGLISGTLSFVGRTASQLDVVQCTPVPAGSATQIIGPRGGTISVGPHTLTVPRGALSRDVAITATVVSESVNRVHFEPAGLRFAKSATLEISYANCNTAGRLLPKRIAYVSSDLSVLFNYLNSVDNLRSSEVRAEVDHFSDYILAW